MDGDDVEDDFLEREESKVVEVEVEDLIKVQEYEESLTGMNNGKCPGKNGISMELMIEGGERLKVMVVELFNS